MGKTHAGGLWRVGFWLRIYCVKAVLRASRTSRRYGAGRTQPGAGQKNDPVCGRNSPLQQSCKTACCRLWSRGWSPLSVRPPKNPVVRGELGPVVARPGVRVAGAGRRRAAARWCNAPTSGCWPICKLDDAAINTLVGYADGERPQAAESAGADRHGGPIVWVPTPSAPNFCKRAEPERPPPTRVRQLLRPDIGPAQIGAWLPP